MNLTIVILKFILLFVILNAQTHSTGVSSKTRAPLNITLGICERTNGCSAHGHCFGTECICTENQWNALDGTVRWTNESYEGERCELHRQCRAAQCERGGGAQCLRDVCVCRNGYFGNRCSRQCDDALSGCSSTSHLRLRRQSNFVQRALDSLPSVARDRVCLHSPWKRLECDAERALPTVAYLILVHQPGNGTAVEAGRALALLRAQLEALYDVDNVYAIHVDAHASAAFFRGVQWLLSSMALGDNVVVLTRRVAVTWSGMSVVRAMLTGAAHLLRIRPNFDFFIHLSGADFPVRSQRHIREYVSARRHRNIVWGNHYAAYTSPYERRAQLDDHLTSSVGECRRGVLQNWRYHKRASARKEVPTPANAHFWSVLSREFVEHLVYSPESVRLRRFFAQTRVPDEKFVLSALLASHRFAHTWLREQTRYLIFADYGDNHPVTLTDEHLDDALRSGALFARKVDLLRSNSLVANILKRIFKK